MNGNLSPLDNLLEELRRWDQELENLFSTSPWLSGIRSVRQGTYPPLNIGSSNDSIDVYLFAAGLDPARLDVSLQQNLLSISGERNTQSPGNATWHRQERFDGSFRRVLTLPEDVDPEQVEARYRDGVLHIRMGRREEVKPRRIEVQ